MSGRAWVTGSAGFVGGRAARRLLELGYEVIGISRRPTPEATRSVQLDLAAPDAVKRLEDLLRREPPALVVHAAAAQPPLTSRTEGARGNVAATAALLDVLARTPPEQLIHLSTLSVYGAPNDLPVDEETPPRPHNWYAESKLTAEWLARDFASVAPVTVLRLPSLYGAGQTDSFIDGLARVARAGEPLELFDEGRLIREVLHVDDVVEPILTAARRPPTGLRLANLGMGRPITVLEYATALAEALGSASEVVPIARPTRTPSLWTRSDRAHRELDFRPRPLADALAAYASELAGYG